LLGAVLSATICLALHSAFAESYKVEAKNSEALTAYLRQHRLPLVGAQVLRDAAGDRRVVLYGFVATAFGKSDAARKALAYLKSTDIPIDNRITIHPEIARMKPATGGALSAPSNESLDQILNEIDHYGVSFPMVEQNPRP
jgi:hypothetical protein